MSAEYFSRHIPYLKFGPDNGAPLHFAHANGYPPGAYAPLLAELAQFWPVYSMAARPLWAETRPADMQDWRVLGEDLQGFLNAVQPGARWVAIGHSVGGTASLLAALNAPERIRGLVLIDPPFFPPLFSRVWNLVYQVGLGYRFHPLAQGALRRRRSFSSVDEMYQNYRRKRVFHGFSDIALSAYVQALALTRADGQVELAYTPEWEARIYVTSARADAQTWRRLASLALPVLLIRGTDTPTFWDRTLSLFRQRVPQVQVAEIPGASHLVPLEKPQETAALIAHFVETLPA